MSVSRRFVCLPLVFAALTGFSLDASALSYRERAAVDALTQRMQAAEAKYREALVKISNADPEGQKQSDAALEDMEDVIADCSKQSGCQISQLLASYKRLLKLSADAEAAGDEGEEFDDPSAHDPDHALAAHVPEAARAAALLNDQRHAFDKMVQYNPAVQAAIRRWLTDMRGALITSHENYQYMRQLMWPHYERAGLPEALLFGIMAKESNGKVHVTSRAGAAGPMQFMYNTGRRFGLGPDATGFDTRYDPRAAAEASAAYLNERMGELNRSIELALAAYNGGEGRALRVYQGGGSNFWQESVYNQFPPETQDYVPMVIAAAWLFLHPNEYGLTFPKVDPKTAPLRLAQPSSIYQLTICLGNGGTREGFMRVLRNLNPRYEADRYLPAGTTLNATPRIVGQYNRWCMEGRRAELARTLVMSDPKSAIVRMGPVIPVQPPVSTFYPGNGSAVAAPELAAASTSNSETMLSPTGDKPVVVAPEVPTKKAVPEKKPDKSAVRSHRVKGGETLTSIARKFGCNTRELAKANEVDAPKYAIRPGQKLKLQGCSKQ